MRTFGRGVLALCAVGFGCAVYIYLTLPDVRSLRTRNPSTTAFIELRAREAQAQGDRPRRVQTWVSYPRISQNLKRAVLVTEDAAFWQHEGIDFDQLRDSIETNLERMEFARGGSTITQQLAKNLYLSPSKNPIRKVREFFIARRLEGELTKQRILELYLNVIEWGDGIYGAEAAARAYFGKSAADLSTSESALLAAAIANPRVFNVGHPTARLRRRQQMIMRRMGAVTPPPATPIAAPEAGPPQPPAADPAGIPAVPGLPAPGGGEGVLPGVPLSAPRAPGPKARGGGGRRP